MGRVLDVLFEHTMCHLLAPRPCTGIVVPAHSTAPWHQPRMGSHLIKGRKTETPCQIRCSPSFFTLFFMQRSIKHIHPATAVGDRHDPWRQKFLIIVTAWKVSFSLLKYIYIHIRSKKTLAGTWSTRKTQPWWAAEAECHGGYEPLAGAVGSGHTGIKLGPADGESNDLQKPAGKSWFWVFGPGLMESTNFPLSSA